MGIDVEECDFCTLMVGGVVFAGIVAFGGRVLQGFGHSSPVFAVSWARKIAKLPEGQILAFPMVRDEVPDLTPF